MSFTENNHNGLIYMSSDKIGARHAFTTRYGGVSTGIFSSLNLGSNRGDDPKAVRENYRRVCGLMGVGIDDMAVTQQVHRPMCASSPRRISTCACRMYPMRPTASSLLSAACR